MWRYSLISHKKGSLLLELLISMSLLLTIVPSICTSYLHVQKKLFKISELILKHTELQFIIYNLRKDAQHSPNIQIAPQQLILHTTPPTIYTLAGHKLKRKQGSTSILNKHCDIQAFTATSTASRLLDIALTYDDIQKQFSIYLPNITL